MYCVGSLRFNFDLRSTWGIPGESINECAVAFSYGRHLVTKRISGRLSSLDLPKGLLSFFNNDTTFLHHVARLICRLVVSFYGPV